LPRRIQLLAGPAQADTCLSKSEGMQVVVRQGTTVAQDLLSLSFAH